MIDGQLDDPIDSRTSEALYTRLTLIWSKIATNTLNDNLLREYLEKIGIKADKRPETA
jgi:hypothetical protein